MSASPPLSAWYRLLLAVVIGIANLLSRGARGTETSMGRAGKISQHAIRELKRMIVSLAKRIFGGGRLTAGSCAPRPRSGAGNFGPPELIEAAKKEGKVIYYTADFAEVEQEIIKAFNKRFPFVKVEMMRAPGGQLITRIKTEAAAGKLSADVINHSDRGLMSELSGHVPDYAPPNGKDYREDSMVSPKLWPRETLVWSIAYNYALIKTPPKTWMDLTKPEYGNKQIGQVFAASGGTTWTRTMFERQVLGEDYWKKQAATDPVLYPSGAPLSDALVRGEIVDRSAALQRSLPKQRDGAPVEILFAARRRAG